MELQKIDLLTVSIFSFVHAYLCLSLIRLFHLQHLIYSTIAIAFFILGLFYLFCHLAGGFLFIGSGFLLFLPSSLYMVFIFSVSSISQLPEVGISGNYFHPLEYLSFSFLLVWALNKGMNPEIKRSTLGITFLVCIICALFDEFHQYFVPGRDASVLDIILDSVGVILGLAMFRIYQMIVKSLLTPKGGQRV